MTKIIDSSLKCPACGSVAMKEHWGQENNGELIHRTCSNPECGWSKYYIKDCNGEEMEVKTNDGKI